jgi:hypothetical protein
MAADHWPPKETNQMNRKSQNVLGMGAVGGALSEIECLQFDTVDLEEPVTSTADITCGPADSDLHIEELEAVIAPGMRLQHNETFFL